MRVVVYGAGAIGCFVAAHLARAGLAPLIIGRPRVVDPLRVSGLSISDHSGVSFHVAAASMQFGTAADIRSGDLILVTVKSAATHSVADEIDAVVAGGNGLSIVSLQNGLGNADRLSARLPNARVFAGMVPYNVAQIDPTRFHRGTEGVLCIERREGSADILGLIRGAGLAIKDNADMTGVLWGKLLMNLNNAVNALSGLPLKQQLETRGYRRVLAALIDEALGILRLAGIRPVRVAALPPNVLPTALRLPDWLFHRLAKGMLRIDAKARSSMADDLALSRTTEIDWLQGEVVRLAESLGIAAPHNAAIHRLVREAEQHNAANPALPRVLWSPQALARTIGLGAN